MKGQSTQLATPAALPRRLRRWPWPSWPVGLTAAALAASACSSASDDPFVRDVIPVLEKHCGNAACHGVTETEAKKMSLDDTKWLTLRIDSRGLIVDPAQALRSAKARVNSAEGAELSSLLRKTLPVTQGGQYHFKNEVFASRQDPAYQTLAKWAASISDGGEGNGEPALTAAEKMFAAQVYPTLVDRGCATSTCHGILMFGGAIFSAPAIAGSKTLSKAELRKTYEEARRNVTLWGDPLRSRLIAKMLPLSKGGIPHKGGNDIFFAREAEQGQEPAKSKAVQDILAWIEAERAASGSPLPTQDPPLVAVGGPIAPAGPFDVAPFLPGTDLYRIDAPYTGTPLNLTAGLHKAPADIRSPALSHDGKKVVFSMRTSAEDAHNIYVMGLDGSGLLQLTHAKSAGPLGRVVGHFSPVFGPNGGFSSGPTAPTERIYWSSTQAADLADVFDVQNADLYAMDPDGQHPERLTWSVIPEVQPWFLATGEFAGTMAYTIKRSNEGGYKGVLFRFPIDHNAEFHIQPEAHPHFGMSEPEQVFWRLRELPDGRATLTLLDQGNIWRGGQLAILERQFAVEVPVGQELKATLPGFRHALTNLSPDVGRVGPSPGLWRDPTPLPDGTLVAARVTANLDLGDDSKPLRPALVRVFLGQDAKQNRPTIAKIEVLQDNPQLAWSEPVAALARPTEDPPHPRKWDDQSATALLVHSGVQVIEAVLRQLSPMAPRPLRDDIAYVRAVVPLSAAAELNPQPVPPEKTRYNLQGASTLSLTGQMPLFAAVEIAPEVDGSLAAKIPAKVPVRVVTLDQDFLAIGTLQHQWYATAPGERFPVGIAPSSYNARCAGCHGALDGKPESVLKPPVDFITQASVTAALYEGQDRRRPKEPPTVTSAMFKFVDFRQHVQPILDNRCATALCHGPQSMVAGLDLTGTPTKAYTAAYENLLRPGNGSADGFEYVDARGLRARRSFLAEKIMNREYEAPRTLLQPCPPPGSPGLTAEEKATLIRWIEFGAAFVGAPPKS